MNRENLIRRVSEELKVSREDARKLVRGIVESMVEVLIQHRKLELRNFGVFRIGKIRGRFVKNPRTGVEMYVAESYTVRFKPSRHVIRKINGENQG
ncbi:histone family protein DNA-binding protein [Thermocrinis albus DSM 14484]|uniref:Histone family protein DNA-binding protein n=1 Tax=Thermocrinis albus (strain DSM 14484 / JCM 11386 / HI 11/12) TaxID=638303 RepID=D3SL67_THEAH|nr:HU family DNA-binding protein [Thermocrinis albus]ADC89497.1 histone family protein DNA-binding protein [Thermocrinis albus DSM 14484]